MPTVPQIQMVDLVGQYKKIATEIHQAIDSVMESSAFINGPAVTRFGSELAKYTGAKFVIPCGNGTDALQIALMALGLQPGDEVIVPSFTYVATVEVIALLQLTPIFVDVNPQSFNMDVELVEKAITKQTKAIIAVHLFGQSADMEPLLNISNQHKIPVVEDNAQALGASYQFSDSSIARTGTMGAIGTTSFFPSKNLGAYGDGGALFTNDPSLAERLKMIANHGQKQKYYHDIVGVNSRLDSLHAAILSVKLNYLNDYAESRQTVADYYDSTLNDIDELTLPFRVENSTHVFHQYTLLVKNNKRDALRDFLQTKGVPSMIYYPVPQHLQKAYLGYGYKEGDFPISEQLCHEVCSIPIHTELTEEQLIHITGSIREFFGK